MTSDHSIPADTAGRQFAALVRDLVGFAGPRLGWVMLAATVAALAEGAGLLLLLPVLSLLGIAGAPGWMGTVLSSLFGPVDLEAALAVYVALVGAAALVVRGRILATHRLRMDYTDDLRQRLHEAVTGMDWRSFARLRASDATQVLTIETMRAAHGVEFLLRIGGWVLQVAALLLVAARLSPAMTGCVLVLAAMAALLARPLNRRTHQLGRAVGETGKAIQADLADDLAGMRVIRAFGMEDARRHGFVRRMTSQRAAALALQHTAGTARAFTQTGAALAVALAMVTAIRGFGLPPADTLVLMLALVRLLMTLLGIQDGWRQVLNALPAHAHAHALLARWNEVREPVAAISSASGPALVASVRLEGVGYRYDDEASPALSGITADIPARKMTALVGPSGSGKSTLADLLLGLTAPTEGVIRVDGVPLEGGGRREWRRRVGYVPQDGFLFHDTIRANLRAAAPGADDAALRRALEQAAAAGFVDRLPQGLDTVVGDRGGRLSGGERQRLALARALLAEPALLILDEATSAVDAANERQILEAIDGLRGRLTVLVIAHRAAMVRNADHVLVLDHGRLVASGGWDEVGAVAGPLLPSES